MFYLNYQIKQEVITGISTYTDYVLEVSKAIDECKGCPYLTDLDSGMPYCGVICCDILETGDCDLKKGEKMENNENETVWIEFEAWLDNVAIQGYMALDEADDEAPLRFYTWDGFEGDNYIQCTRYPSFDDDELFKWEVLAQWFAETDVVQWLVDFAEEEKKVDFIAESDWGRRFDVEFYINCSKLNNGGN